ncbi:MAG: 50S ribosomal protein L3 [Bacteroidetes bacterium]|nr:50S ribosomal protein L3 [Bacteroidota bacterium]MCH8325142.1 50S ribosomal protein L3 [Bacteroidota bacterium]
MSGILGKKLGMSSIYGEKGRMIPVTAIQAGPCKVVTIRTQEKDGYEALQIGFGTRKEKNLNKPILGHFKKNNVESTAYLKEFRFDEISEYKVGDEIKADFFKEGEKIKVRAKSKGKGFQGVIKRHGFKGVGGTTHGQSNRLRAPGSIGQSSDPSRVFKGMRMAGRTGGKFITVSNLEVIKVIPEENLILVNGSVPGPINSIVELVKQ